MILAVQYLDESMSWERNLTPGEKCSNMRWDHQSICKYYLCGFCPVELFTNIHSDLGHKNWDREQERKSKWKEKRGSDDKKKVV
uniref:Uncharacterized protein n=1 Tax=Sus scrofa TaxID=9823 RepID=A0A8D1G7A6_PIG